MLDGKLGQLFAPSKSLSEDLVELKQDLSTLNQDKQRAALHRVMTLLSSGRNVSQLFPEVLNAMHSSQLDTKRLAHQYFLIYHRQFADLSILAINALKKDAEDPNPLIRALSLKTLAAIRLEDAAEYLVDPVKKALNDSDPYVRKTAVLAVAKLCHFHSSLTAEHGLIDLVLDLLTDGNPAVVGNAAASITEFLNNKFPIRFDLQRANALLSALNDSIFSDPQVAATTIARLTPLLSHGNPGVVLGAARLIALLISRCTDFTTIRATLHKLVAPLVSFLGSDAGGSAVQFDILRSIGILAAKKTGIKMPLGPLLIKYADSVAVKKEKIKLLAMIDFGANEADRVLIELKEIAATEVEAAVVVTAVEAIGSLAVRPVAAFQADKVVSALLDVLDAFPGTPLGASSPSAAPSGLAGSMAAQIKATILVQLVTLIRSFPGSFEAVIATIIEAWASLSAVSSTVTDAVAFVVADNASRIQAETALSVFERIFTSEAELSSVVLTSAIKLAISLNNKNLLKTVIDRATAPLSSVDPDIRDRGRFYAKLIQTDPALAKEVVNSAVGKRVRRVTAVGIASNDLAHIGRLSSMYDLPVVFRPRPLRNEGGREGDDEEENSSVNLVIVEGAKPQVSMSSTTAVVNSTVRRVSEVQAPSAATNTTPTTTARDSDDEDAVAGITKYLVVKADQPGAPGGVRGLRVAAGVGRSSDNRMFLALTVGNGTNTSTLTGPFLVQVNRNSKGLAAKSKLIVNAPERLLPGEAFNGHVELIEVDAMKQGTAPLTTLQVAIKTAEDVWYFSVPV